MKGAADLLAFGIEHVLMPIVVWSLTFATIAVVLGILGAHWASKRWSGGSGRVWAGRAVLIVGCFLVPFGIAVFHAVPFAVTRGLASGLERATPSVTGWVMDLTTSHAMTLLDVKNSDVVLDVSAVASGLARAIANSAPESSGSLRGMFLIAQRECLKLLDRTIRTLGPADGRVTWRALERAARDRAVAESHLVFGGFAAALRATALAHLLWAAILILICQALAVLGYRAVRR